MPRGVKGSGIPKEPSTRTRIVSPEAKLKSINKKITSLQKEIDDLQKERDVIIGQQQESVKDEILKRMKELGMKPEDLIQ